MYEPLRGIIEEEEGEEGGKGGKEEAIAAEVLP